MKISDAVAGHDIERAIKLAHMTPKITTARGAQRITGDIGRLMPLAESDHLKDLTVWIDHLARCCAPCVVTRRRDGRYVLYKERRVRTGCQWQAEKK